MSGNAFATRVLAMARSVMGKPFEDWPAWSTGEKVAVALVLNDHAALYFLGYTMAGAFDRLDGELTVQQACRIELELANG